MTRFAGPIAATAATIAVAQAAVWILSPRQKIDQSHVDATAYFTQQQLDRAAGFRDGQLVLGLVGLLVQGGVLMVLARRKARGGAHVEGASYVHSRVGRLRRAFGRSAVFRGALAGVGLALAVSIVPAPIYAIARQRSVDVGLSTGTWLRWLQDLATTAAITAVGGAIVGAVIVAVVRRWPRRWWIAAATLSAAATLALTFVQPLVIDPLFNKNTPVNDPKLVAQIQQISNRAGVEVDDVLVSDASKRTTAVNAMVTGFGSSRRVVFWDTLLKQFPPEQVKLVVAHELSHAARNDIPRGLALALILMVPSALVVSMWSRRLTPLEGGHPDGRGGRLDVSVPAVIATGAILSFALAPIGNQFSRAIEARADHDALVWTSDPQAMADFQQKIALSNLGRPQPSAVARFLFGTHPSTLDRIGIAESFAKRNGIKLRTPSPVDDGQRTTGSNESESAK